MNKAVYKYNFVSGEAIVVPRGSKILKAGKQGDQWVVWLEVNLAVDEKVSLNLVVRGTGWHFEGRGSQHIDTVFDGDWVWHVYKVVGGV